MGLNAVTVLSAIGYTEPSNFGEFCAGLGSDKPEGKDDWRIMFGWIDRLGALGSIEIDRIDGKIDSMQLTESGAVFLKENSR